MSQISFEAPIKTVSEGNCSEHWTKKSKRHKQQQFFVRLFMNKHFNKNISLPCSIKLTRLSSRFLDDDNLRTAFKYIRDEISEHLIPEKKGYYIVEKKDKKGNVKISVRPKKGRADSDPRISWDYGQEKAKTMGIRVEITRI